MNFKEYKTKRLSENKGLREKYAKLKDERVFNYEIGEKVRRARHSRAITQKKLSEMIGTHQPSIARVENGSHRPSLDFLKRISDTLKLTLDVNFNPQTLDKEDSLDILGREVTNYPEDNQGIKIDLTPTSSSTQLTN